MPSLRSFRSALRRAMYKHGWDTKCRNAHVSRLLAPELAPFAGRAGRPLLDVGCGDSGVAAFLPNVSVHGVDVETPGDPAPNLHFEKVDGTNLPFADDSFPVVSCVDVLEHLPPDRRELLVGEAARVASHAVLLAFPHGAVADACDRDFKEACAARGVTPPDWVLEHQSQEYPTADGVARALASALEARGKRARIDVVFSEPEPLCRLIRAASVRSNALYAATNLALGLLYPAIPKPGETGSYRALVRAKILRPDAPDPGDGGPASVEARWPAR